jgi:hypothetical protein
VQIYRWVGNGACGQCGGCMLVCALVRVASNSRHISSTVCTWRLVVPSCSTLRIAKSSRLGYGSPTLCRSATAATAAAGRACLRC